MRSDERPLVVVVVVVVARTDGEERVRKYYLYISAYSRRL